MEKAECQNLKLCVLMIKTKQFVELAFSLGFILSIEYEDEYEERTLH